MSQRDSIRSIVAVICTQALLACAPNDVVIAELDGGARSDAGASNESEAGDGSSVDDRPCRATTDCAGEDFCEKQSCGSESGFCHHIPDFCDASRSPVCGCDQVTYWNDCLRRQSGVASARGNECDEGATCQMATDCPGSGASCARLLAPGHQCPPGLPQNPPPVGECWHLPPVCPTNDDGDPASLLPCEDMNGGTCQTACTTIRSEKPATRSTSCDTAH
jgi:hypothetical protein